MKTVAAQVRRFLESEHGPTAVEYAVMLALIIVVCVVALLALGQNMHRTFDRIWDTLRAG